MKILVIPDVHLKPWMFIRAGELMKTQEIHKAVCLMDIADDWNRQLNLELYFQTYDAVLSFATEYPETLWCYGNHDLCYLWDQRESGYSAMAAWSVCEKLHSLRASLLEERQLAFLHRIDNVLFSHAGLTDDFVKRFVPKSKYNDVDAVVESVNHLGKEQMWTEDSPIWTRPQDGGIRMYKPRKLWQVVGHTPTTEILKQGKLISCDVFSTYRTGDPIGTQEFLILDTLEGKYRKMR